MKRIKLDENFPPDCIALFTQENVDASSVFKQEISGTNDDNLYQICINEKRTIVSFDLDFANILRYPVNITKGIIVCRVRKRTNLGEIKLLCSVILQVIINNDLDGKLFIIDSGKVRVRKSE